MRRAVYNSAIPTAIFKSVNRSLYSGCPISVANLFLFFLITSLSVKARAADWNRPEQELARKIVAVTGPGVVALALENRSSLGQRDSEIIQNGLRSELAGLGLHVAAVEQSLATVKITLSENVTSYVWVAEIRQSAGDSAVVIVSAPRPEGSASVRESVPLSLRKIQLWTQDDPILDVAVLEENPTPTEIAVLDPEKVSFYRLQSGKWQPEQALSIAHTRPWPRDLRGRLIPGRDHLLDVYLPGVVCLTATPPLGLNCRESDDPWPLVPSAGAAPAVPQMKAFFAPTRNFFTGTLNPGIGKFMTVPKFYSAALLPRDKYTLWFLAGTDGLIHMIDGVSDQTANFSWGSDLASLRTTCGAGWQILATTPTGIGDSIRAYEFPDRDPVAVSAALDFPGAITALWTEAKGDTAIAVTKDRETGTYEAFRLALACGQ
jgi:hypothetical protein